MINHVNDNLSNTSNVTLLDREKKVMKRKHESYWKFTGDKVIVLFASNIMVPLTAGSFLLILKQQKKSTN